MAKILLTGSERAAIPGARVVAPANPAGWFPDPGGAHDHRYWDGTRWTEHVADAVLYMAGLPLEANVLTMTVMASGMPFVNSSERSEASAWRRL